MLKALFSSTTRVKLLKTFLLSPQNSEFFIRELTRKIDEQINSVRRELDNLKKIGFLKVKNKDRKKFYRINTNFLLYNELKSMFQKGASQADEICKKISRMGKIELLILSGMFVGKEDGVDIIIVGEIDKDKLYNFVSKGINSEREVRFSVFTREEFDYRMDCKDKFIKDILKDTKNIRLIDKIHN